MTNTEKKAWLRRYRQALDNERRLRNAIRAARSRAEATTQALRPTPGGSGGQDKVAAGVELLDSYQRKLADQLAESERLRAEIEQAIDALPSADLRLVMRARYIDGRSWKQIADQQRISERWARGLHERALKKIKTVPNSSALQW